MKIENVELRRVRLPLVSPFRTSFGSVSERDLLDALFAGTAALADPVERHMGASLPLVGAGEPVAVAVESLEHADAVIVVADGLPTGVLTRQDLLGYLTH